MVIKISNLRKAGTIYDTSKLAILGNKITGSIKQRTKGQFIAKSRISLNRTMIITLKKYNAETKRFSKPTMGEQEILAGRISNFLNNNGISHDISTK